MAISEVKASSSEALDAAFDTTIPGMFIAPGPGTYLVVFSMDVEFTDPAGAETLEVGIDRAGFGINAQTRHQIDSHAALDGVKMPICTTGDVTITGAENIRARYNATAAGEFVCTNRQMTIFPIALGSFENGSSTPTSLSVGGEQNVAGLSSSLGAEGVDDYLLVVSFSLDAPGGTVVEVRVKAGPSGSETLLAHSVRQFENEASAPNTKQCMMIAVHIPGGAVNDAVRIAWERISGAGTINMSARRMVLVKTQPTDIFEKSETNTDDASTTPDQEIDDMEIIPGDPGDFLGIFSCYDSLGTIVANQTHIYTLYLDGSPIANTDRSFERHAEIDDIVMPIFCNGKVTFPLGTEPASVYWGASGTETREIFERTYVMIRELVPVPEAGGGGITGISAIGDITGIS